MSYQDEPIIVGTCQYCGAECIEENFFRSAGLDFCNDCAPELLSCEIEEDGVAVYKGRQIERHPNGVFAVFMLNSETLLGGFDTMTEAVKFINK